MLAAGTGRTDEVEKRKETKDRERDCHWQWFREQRNLFDVLQEKKISEDEEELCVCLWTTEKFERKRKEKLTLKSLRSSCLLSQTTKWTAGKRKVERKIKLSLSLYLSVLFEAENTEKNMKDGTKRTRQSQRQRKRQKLPRNQIAFPSSLFFSCSSFSLQSLPLKRRLNQWRKERRTGKNGRCQVETNNAEGRRRRRRKTKEDSDSEDLKDKRA